MRSQRGPLPVDPTRLQRQFPELTADDLAAYTEMTGRILSEPSPDRRAQLIRDTLARARLARDRQASGGALTDAEALDLRYLNAVAKMQATIVK